MIKRYTQAENVKDMSDWMSGTYEAYVPLEVPEFKITKRHKTPGSSKFVYNVHEHSEDKLIFRGAVENRGAVAELEIEEILYVYPQKFTVEGFATKTEARKYKEKVEREAYKELRKLREFKKDCFAFIDKDYCMALDNFYSDVYKCRGCSFYKR